MYSLLGRMYCGNVWKCRCKWVFERIPFTTDVVQAMTATNLTCTEGARQNAHETTSEVSEQNSWSAPTQNELKFKVDAGLGKSSTCVAVVGRGSTGQMVEVAAISIASTDKESDVSRLEEIGN